MPGHLSNLSIEIAAGRRPRALFQMSVWQSHSRTPTVAAQACFEMPWMSLVSRTRFRTLCSFVVGIVSLEARVVRVRHDMLQMMKHPKLMRHLKQWPIGTQPFPDPAAIDENRENHNGREDEQCNLNCSTFHNAAEFIPETTVLSMGNGAHRTQVCVACPLCRKVTQRVEYY